MLADDTIHDLGNPDDVADAEAAGPLAGRLDALEQRAVDAINDTPDTARRTSSDAQPVGERTARQRGIEKGVEKFWETLIGEKVPELAAKATAAAGAAIGSGIAAASGLAAGHALGVAPERTAIVAAALHALRSLLRGLFR
jgi:hypothetical protein